MPAFSSLIPETPRFGLDSARSLYRTDWDAQGTLSPALPTAVAEKLLTTRGWEQGPDGRWRAPNLAVTFWHTSEALQLALTAEALMPEPNEKQQAAIDETIATFRAATTYELETWKPIDPAEFLQEGETTDGLYVEFTYRNIVAFETSETPGREITVFADDGAVLFSQDLG